MRQVEPEAIQPQPSDIKLTLKVTRANGNVEYADLLGKVIEKEKDDDGDTPHSDPQRDR